MRGPQSTTYQRNTPCCCPPPPLIAHVLGWRQQAEPFHNFVSRYNTLFETVYTLVQVYYNLIVFPNVSLPDPLLSGRDNCLHAVTCLACKPCMYHSKCKNACSARGMFLIPSTAVLLGHVTLAHGLCWLCCTEHLHMSAGGNPPWAQPQECRRHEL
jgi:hypothetical protein